MTRTLVTLCCLFMALQTFAADVLIKAGGNYSWFDTEGGSSDIMPAFGVSVQFPLDESQKIYLGIDAIYVGQKMILKDKSWPSSLFPIDKCKLTSGNLYIDYRYIKFPLYFSTTVFYKNKLSLAMEMGLSYAFSLGSKSDADYFDHDGGNCEHDYERVTADSDPAYPTEIMIGPEICYKRLGLCLIYSYTLSKTDRLIGLKIQDHIHSIRLMLNWYVKKSK